MKKSESESKGKSTSTAHVKPDKPQPKPAHKVLDRSQKISNQVNVTNIVNNGPRLPPKHHHKPSTSQQHHHHHHPKPNTSHLQKTPAQSPSLPAAGASQANTHEKKFIPKPKNFNKPIDQQSSSSNISINLSVDLQTLLNVLPQNQNLTRPYNPPNQQQNPNLHRNFNPNNKYQQQPQQQKQQNNSGKNQNEKPHRVNKQSEGAKVHHKSQDKTARS